MSQLHKTIHISALMEQSGVKFGTSGARGLAVDMSDRVCYTYTLAFLQYLKTSGDLVAGSPVAIAGDYRSSTPQIMAAVAMAIKDADCNPVNCGFIPTPALAHYAISQNAAGIMVTGSHIPEDRNGIKFYKPCGEILKGDEQDMCSQHVTIACKLFDEQGNAIEPYPLPEEDSA
ncbi:MAG: phosphomannomutase, partial [Mariprofundaceae bacterium]